MTLGQVLDRYIGDEERFRFRRFGHAEGLTLDEVRTVMADELERTVWHVGRSVRAKDGAAWVPLLDVEMVSPGPDEAPVLAAFVASVRRSLARADAERRGKGPR